MRKHILFAAAALLAAPLTASADGMNKGRAYDVPGTDVTYSHTVSLAVKWPAILAKAISARCGRGTATCPRKACFSA